MTAIVTGATAIAIYFIQRFISSTDKEIDKLKSTVGKTAIDVSEKTTTIRFNLSKLEDSFKTTAEKVQTVAQKIGEVEEQIEAGRELHRKTAEVLRAQSERLSKTEGQVETVLKHMGNITIVKERKK